MVSPRPITPLPNQQHPTPYPYLAPHLWAKPQPQPQPQPQRQPQPQPQQPPPIAKSELLWTLRSMAEREYNAKNFCILLLIIIAWRKLL